MDFQQYFNGKTILVTGGAGFIGSHLTEKLISFGASVVVVDNFITGNRKNLSHTLPSNNVQLIEADASNSPELYLDSNSKIDGIFHLASPASPKGYGKHPVETYQVNGFGTHYLAAYATKYHIPLLYTSTSESYGDPLEHPQKETYWGNVNPTGTRACYDESKRFGEMVMTTWCREHGLDGRVVRIFNTYGPRMDPNDGRVTPDFIRRALQNEPIQVFGDGSQTRSFCFVDDIVEYLMRVFVTPEARSEVINIGNPDEYTMIQFAEKIKALVGSTSTIEFKPLPQDDPTRRKPDIHKAIRILGYEPQVSLETGLLKTIDWFKNV